MTNDTRNHHALSVTDAGGSVLGRNYVVGHVLVQGVDPILMTEARWALTALLLGLLYRRQIAGSRHCCGQTPRRWWANPLRPVSFPLTLYIGLQTTSALNAAIYMSATPSMVLLINRLIFVTRYRLATGWGHLQHSA